MSVLDPLTQAGLRVSAKDGRLFVSPRARVTDETRIYVLAHRQELLDLLTKPRWLWLVHHADGQWISHSFTPEATLAQVRAWHPDALDIRPEHEPHEDQEAQA